MPKLTIHDIITKLKHMREMHEWEIPIGSIDSIIADVQILEAERESAVRENVRLRKKIRKSEKGGAK